jgi:hypothetical protein
MEAPNCGCRYVNAFTETVLDDWVDVRTLSYGNNVHKHPFPNIHVCFRLPNFWK